MEVPGCGCEVGSLSRVIIATCSMHSAYFLCRLEERRKVKGAAYYERKKAVRRQLSEAKKNAKVDEKTKTQLEEYGY